MNQTNDGHLVQIRTASMARDLNYYEPSRHIYLEDKKQIVTSMMTQQSLPYVMSFFVPTQEVLRDWLEKEHGMYIELTMEGWGDDEKIQSPAFRAFVWRIGFRKPAPHDDLGCTVRRTHILEIALEDCLATLLQETQPKNRHLKDREHNNI